LFQALNNEEKAKRLENTYGFRNRDFFELSAKHDIFSQRIPKMSQGELGNTGKESSNIFTTNFASQPLYRLLISKIILELRNFVSVPKLLLHRLLYFVKTKNKRLLLPTSKLFWKNWYLNENDDVKESGMDPYTHYLVYGWRERRNPNPFFDCSYYLIRNPDVAASGVDPMTHYLVNGWKEGRNPSPFFDGIWYATEYFNVHRRKLEPLTHYLNRGWREKRKPSREFSVRAFRRYYPKLKWNDQVHWSFFNQLLLSELEEYVLSDLSPEVHADDNNKPISRLN
jgi:hypothetical protein